jgi:hypothetical protein
MSYYRTTIGGIPLNFLLCDHAVVTAEQLLAAYADINTELPRNKQVALSVVETADQRFDAPFNPEITEHHG